MDEKPAARDFPENPEAWAELCALLGRTAALAHLRQFRDGLPAPARTPGDMREAAHRMAAHAALFGLADLAAASADLDRSLPDGHLAGSAERRWHRAQADAVRAIDSFLEAPGDDPAG